MLYCNPDEINRSLRNILTLTFVIGFVGTTALAKAQQNSELEEVNVTGMALS